MARRPSRIRIMYYTEHQQRVMATRLVAFRTARHLSQQALAERLHLSVATVSRWERSLSCPSRLVFERLQAMGFSL